MSNTETNITIRMSRELKAMLMMKAKASGKTISEYIRELIATNEVKPTKSKDYGKLLGAVNIIGNNINQIARNLNTANKQGTLADENYDELLHLLLLIWNNTKALLDDERNCDDNQGNES